MGTTNALVVAAFNMSAAVLLPRAKRIDAKMSDGIDNDACDELAQELDAFDEADTSADYDTEIIDEIEHDQAEIFNPGAAVGIVDTYTGPERRPSFDRGTDTPLMNETDEERDDLADEDDEDDQENENITDVPGEDVFQFNSPEWYSDPSQIPESSPMPMKVKITLRRHKTTGFGFRPVSGVAPEPIVTAVIKGSSAFRQGLKVGDRIRSVVIPPSANGGVPQFNQISSVSQIKEILGNCQDSVELYVYRDMREITTELVIQPMTPLGLGLQTTNVGIFVTSVQPGSIGDIYDYRFGDQILSINDQPVHDSNDIRKIRRSSMLDSRRVQKKPIAKLFRSASSLSHNSRAGSRQDRYDDRRTSWNDERSSEQERIKIIIGRRSVESYSEHPIAAIWAESENRSSPLNILEPTFDPSTASAPTESIIGDVVDVPSTVASPSLDPLLEEQEEEELIDMLREKRSVESSPQVVYQDEPYLFESSSPLSSTSSPTRPQLGSSNRPSLQQIPTPEREVNSACVVCLEGTKEIVFQPCWHQITCPGCAVRLKECPLCREVIAIRRRPYRC